MATVKELFDLTGKTAIITGGGRGLGEQIAEAYAESGVNVVLCSRKVENCQETAERLQSVYGIKTLALECDVTKPEDVQTVVDQTIRKLGRIDILVNNSGVSWGAPAAEMPIDAWKKVIDVNVTGTFLMSQAVGKKMIEQQSGKIINMASIAGLGRNRSRLFGCHRLQYQQRCHHYFYKRFGGEMGAVSYSCECDCAGVLPDENVECRY